MMANKLRLKVTQYLWLSMQPPAVAVVVLQNDTKPEKENPYLKMK